MSYLLTTDDGWTSKGYQALIEAFEDEDIVCVAPYANCSGMGSARTLGEPVGLEAIRSSPVPIYVLNGTPVDCVEWALTSGKFKGIDCALAGINYGANVGALSFACSGTVAAARVAAIRGVRGIALSQHVRGRKEFKWPEPREIRRVVKEYYDYNRGIIGEEHYFNVNFPNRKALRGITNTGLSSSGGYTGKFVRGKKTNQHVWKQTWKAKRGSDFDADLLERGYITATMHDANC